MATLDLIAVEAARVRARNFALPLLLEPPLLLELALTLLGRKATGPRLLELSSSPAGSALLLLLRRD